ncbi:MAG: copper chaperone PCu(A)C [Proteobacteria bacterium]|nr:copper chaperone PCu(A)C [Pseudomonadota bacterium]
MRLLIAVLLSVVMASTAAFAGEIKIERASSLEMPEGLPTAGVFMIVTNDGPADKLLSAKTDIAETTMLHTMDVNEKTGALVMNESRGFDVPENGSLIMAPGSNHIMLIGMKRQLKKDETFPLTLTFEKAGVKQIDVEVIANSKMSDRFPAELSSEVIDKMVAVKKKLGMTDEKRSGWDTLREKIQNLFRKDKAAAASGTTNEALPTREEMENRIKMDDVANGKEADGAEPVVDTAPVEPAPPAPIATDPVDTPADTVVAPIAPPTAAPAPAPVPDAAPQP